MKCSLVRRLAAAALLFFITAGSAFSQMKEVARAATVDESAVRNFSGFAGVNAKSLMKEIDASADVFEYIGDNMIVRGHVVIRTPEMQLTADQAVIHIPTRDVEAFGNVALVRKASFVKTVDMEEYGDLLDDVRKKVEVQEIVTTPLGKKRIKVKVTETTAYLQAERLAGNLNTGALKFQNFAMKSGALYVASSFARRDPSGEIMAENTRLTTCEYIMDDHDHYALTASRAYITPRHYSSGLMNYNPDHSDHSVLLTNSLLRLWDIPVFWFPALYKPRETDSFGVDISIGEDSDWGFWVRSSKNFELYDDPYVNVGAMLDYYSDRGLGGGMTATIVTGNSRTEFFGYGMRDRSPWHSREDHKDKVAAYKKRLRLDIPKHRYDFKVSNLTHITPRLDFRGQMEFISDLDFLDDYFTDRYKENTQPPTYAALEYQADWASFSVLGTARINDFDSVLQRLPEVRMDIPRQELFGGLYYQSETSAGYLYNRWRTFEERSKYGKLENYGSGRIDSLHMLYYPLMLDFVNIVPRAGIRLTGYTAYSKNDITNEDLNAMFGANSLEAGLKKAYPFKNFQVRNSAKFRFMSEFGVEVNTKIYRTWQNVRSSWLGLDGLRHVMVPYINYTYIPKSNLDPENILYFDDVDRLDEQNFVRLGLTNRLQTRDGNYGAEKIREWASLETYWDFHAIRRDGFGNIGDLGIKLSFTPIEDLTLTSEMILDVGGNNDLKPNVTRGDRDAGRPGLLQWRELNEWNTTLEYSITKEWILKASYKYSNRYWRRSVYSMGSMVDAINATSTSLKVLQTPSQEFDFSLAFPTYIDPRLKGEIYLTYDINEALLEDVGIRLTRDFHCFKAGVEFGCETERDDGKKETDFYISGFVSLSAMPNIGFSKK